jgi:YVTN family beta-propeller protein
MKEQHGGYLLLAASVSHCVLDFIDSVSGERLGRIADLVAQPHEIAVDEGRRLAYITHPYREGGYGGHAEPGHEITVVDVDQRSVRAVIDIAPFAATHDVEHDPIHDVVLAGVEANEAGNGVLVLEPVTGAILDHIPTAARNCHWLAVSSLGDRCYVAHKEAPFISAIDIESRAAVGEIPVVGGCEEIDVSADGRWLFAVTPVQTSPLTLTGPSKLLKISTETLQVVGQVDLEPACAAMRVASGRVLVSQMVRPGGQGSGRLWVIDGQRMSVQGAVELERSTFTSRATPDGRIAFVANAGSGTVSVVDLEALQRVATIECTPGETLGGTHGMALIKA